MRCAESGLPIRLTLTILPGVSVTPRNTRAVVWRSTWLTSGIIASNSCFIPCRTACCFRFTTRFTPLGISSENRCAWFRTCRQPHQLPVFLLHPLFLFLAFGAAEPSNLHHPVSDRPQPIPHSRPLLSHHLADLFHDP